MTAGMNSIREQAHARQHHILDQYVRAHTERKCAEFLATIPRLDQEIVAFRERGQHEEEQAQRKAGDDTAALIAETFLSTALSR